MQVISSLFIAITPFTQAETLSSTTDIAEVSTRANFGSDANTTQKQEWESNESNQQDRLSAEKVVSTVASLVQKYHQDGTENLPEHDYRRRFLLDSPNQYQYENELYHRDKDQNPPSQQFHQQYQKQKYQQPYQQQQNQQKYQQQQQFQQPYQQQQYQQHRIRDETYPVAIHGCGHSINDASGSYSGADTQFPNQGVLQSWLAGSGWRNSHSDGNKYPSQPLQVTTATPKTVPSYRNRDYTKYDFNHQDKRGDIYQSRYNQETRTSATPEYNSPVQDFQRSPPSWMQPYSQPQQQHLNRNNRIVYYEYNLEDRRPGSGRCHPMDRNCGSTSGQHDNRWYGSGSSGQRNHLDDGSHFQSSDEYYYRNQQPYYSQPEVGRTVDSREPQVYDYLGEDYHRYRNDRLGDGSRQNLGIGYVYSVDLPLDRAISPSTAYTYDVGYRRKNQDYRQAPVPRLET